MKIEHEYCDVCGKQMDYLSGGDRTSNGIQMTSQIEVKYHIRTSCGSSHPIPTILSAKAFCSFECFEKTLGIFREAVRAATTRLLPNEVFRQNV